MNKPARDTSVILILFRLVVGCVLIYAGFRKAVAPAAEFMAAIDSYHLLPYVVIPPIARALPWVEMWTGTYLIAGFCLPYAAAVASILFGFFLGALATSLARGIDLASCGCFGAEALTPRQTIGMDIVLFIFSLLLVFNSRPNRRYTVDAWLERLEKSLK